MCAPRRHGHTYRKNSEGSRPRCLEEAGHEARLKFQLVTIASANAPARVRSLATTHSGIRPGELCQGPIGQGGGDVSSLVGFVAFLLETTPGT